MNNQNLPDDWKVLPLSQLGSFSKGKGITKSDLQNEELPCIRYGEIYTLHHHSVKRFHSFINTDVARSSKKLKFNDLLFAGSGETLEEIGKAVGYRLKQEAFAGGDIVILSLKDQYRADYIAYYLNTLGRKQINKLGTGHSVVHIYSRALEKVFVILPPLHIQESIVEYIEQWDTAIEKTEALIDAKERQFGWLRSQLIKSCSGKIYKLEELEALKIIKLGRGDVISKKDFEKYPGSYPVYSSSVKKNGVFGKYGKFMFEQKLITWSIDGGGDFFYRPKHKFSVTNVCGYMTVNEEKLDYAFLTAQLQLLHARLVFDYQYKAHPSVIRKIYKAKLPSLEEQKRIAHILNTAQQEITLLKKLCRKYRTQKRGLMQKLLSGQRKINHG